MDEVNLPDGWAQVTIDELIGVQGVFRDGDWVESKDQDPEGDVRLVQLADIGDGEFRDKSFRFLSSEKAAELNCTFLQNGDVLVARMPDPLGRACIFPLHGDKKFVTVVDVCVIRFGHHFVDEKYFMHILNSPMSRRRISDHQTGSTRKRISRGNLSTVHFPIAPLNEQHRIVTKIEELFSDLDQGIENLKTAREQLKVYRQALLKHAFEGKLTVQWREERRANSAHTVIPAKAGIHADQKLDPRPTLSRGQALRGGDELCGLNDEPLETAAALLARVQTEREQRYQQQLQQWQKSPSVPLLQRGKPTSAASTSTTPPFAKGGLGGISKPKAPKPLPPLTAEELAELPELPEGWGWTKFSEFTENFDGKRIPLSSKERENKKGPYPYYGACSVIDRVDAYLFDGDYLLIGEDGANLLSKSKPLAFSVSGKFWVNNHAHIVRPLECCNLKFLEYQFSALNLSKYVTGTAQPKLTQANLDKVPIALCSLSEQLEIIAELEAKLSEVDQLDLTLTASLQQAEALRQSILKRAFSGQLVPQDSNDEPAAALLARIQAEKTRHAEKPKKSLSRSKRNE